MKAIVKVKPGTHLLDISYNQRVLDDRPAVVSLTYFIHQHIGFGSLKPLAGDLPDTASDKDFAEFWKNSNGDEELAVQSYLSSLVVEDQQQLNLEVEKVIETPGKVEEKIGEKVEEKSNSTPTPTAKTK